MLQRIWALLLLVTFVAAQVKLASGATDKKLLLPSSPSQKKEGDNQNQRLQLIKTFEKHLLDMFGLSTRPRPRRNATVSDYMWDLYRKQDKLNKGLHGRPANTIRCFRAEEDDNSKPQKASFKFDISSLPSHEIVWAAEFVVYRRPSTSSPVHRLRVFDVVRPDSNHTNSILRLVDTRVLSGQSSQGRWESFDVLPAMSRWRGKPSLNHGLVVETTTNKTDQYHHVRLKRDVHETHEQWLEFQPLLVIYSRDSNSTTSSSVKRTRRSTRKHRRKGRKNNCGRHALYVDFSDVGWNDWIVAPPGYDAYFCHGECPFPLADHLNSTNHAIVQTLMNSVNPAAVPRACCVPTELSPISMLYVDEYEKVVLKNYQDMVVEGCGCR